MAGGGRFPRAARPRRSESSEYEQVRPASGAREREFSDHDRPRFSSDDRPYRPRREWSESSATPGRPERGPFRQRRSDTPPADSEGGERVYEPAQASRAARQFVKRRRSMAEQHGGSFGDFPGDI